MSCPDRHARDDARLGEPLCPDCYDYTGAVLFNACAPELWRRFTIALRRALARQAGLTNKALAAQVRVSFAKVAEYQRRGVVHFHAIIRLDGPDGPTTAPPAWATVDLLTAAIAQAAGAVHLDTPAAPGLPARTLAWGRELDTRPDHHHRGTHRHQGRRLRRQVRHQGRRMHRHPRPPHHPRRPARPSCRVREHARRLIAECLRLGKLPELDDLRLAAWAHMLGFRGHFSTKSRRYSTTLGALRAERAAAPARARRHRQPLAARLTTTPRSSSPTGDSPDRPTARDRCPQPTPAPLHRSLTGGRPAMTRLLLTVPEAAEALAISRSKLYELLAAGLVRSVRIDGSRRVPVEALETYVARLLDQEEAADAEAS